MLDEGVDGVEVEPVRVGHRLHAVGGVVTELGTLGKEKKYILNGSSYDLIYDVWLLTRRRLSEN